MTELTAIHQEWLKSDNPTLAEAEAYHAALHDWMKRNSPGGLRDVEPEIQTPGQLAAWCRHRQELFTSLDEDPTSPRPVIVGAIRFAWKQLRILAAGRLYPYEPRPPRDYAEAIRCLDPVIGWCTATVAATTVPVTAAGIPPTPQPRFQFRKVGSIWHVRFEAEYGTFPDTYKGFGYIAELLGKPNWSVEAVSLAPLGATDPAEMVGGSAIREGDHLSEAATAPTPEGDTGERIDEEAFEEYKARLQEIQAQERVAQDNGDQEALARLKRDKKFFVKELKRARGIGNRPRTLGTSSAALAADAVRKNRDRAYDQLRPSMPRLVEHLKKAIRQEGTSFAYRPDDPPPEWDL